MPIKQFKMDYYLLRHYREEAVWVLGEARARYSSVQRAEIRQSETRWQSWFSNIEMTHGKFRSSLLNVLYISHQLKDRGYSTSLMRTQFYGGFFIILEKFFINRKDKVLLLF